MISLIFKRKLNRLSGFVCQRPLLFHPKVSLIHVGVTLTLFLFAKQSLAEEIFFNPNALEIDNPNTTPIDLSRFSTKGGQAPGTYRVDIYINSELQETRDVEFVEGTTGKLMPKLTLGQYRRWGVAIDSAAELKDVAEDKVITDLSSYIPSAKIIFDFQHQILKISVPQALMRTTAQGTIDPQYWDEGVTALLLSYGLSGSREWHSQGVNDNYFLNLHSGFNIGGWRLRNYSTAMLNKNSDNTGNNNEASNENNHLNWDSIDTYIQHDIPSIKGQFIAGESYTPSDVFDSIPFRGVQIGSDDNMMPDSLRGFAPTIRGIANSNAQVTVKQDGNVIYQTYVSPGAFSIKDLYPTSSSGELQIIVKESDGSEHTFIQPFSNVAVMQREGNLKYAAMVGKYRPVSSHDDNSLIEQSTLIYGLPHDMTVYGGVQHSPNYRSAALGLGVGLGDWGAFSVDATQANTSLTTNEGDINKKGQSYRFQYSKSIAATDSTITLAGYRYSTKGFYTLQESLDYDQPDDTYNNNWHGNKRSKLQLTFSQNLVGLDWGSLAISGYQQDYWNEEGYERNLSVSYNNSFVNGIAWSLMYMYTQYTNKSANTSSNTHANNKKQVSINVSIPLGKWLPGAYATTSMNSDLHGGMYSQAGISGTALKDNNLSYYMSQGTGNNNQNYNGQVGMDYKGSYGELNVGYNYSDNSRQVNYGAQGSVVVHQHGITFGQPLVGDISALALVEAPGADNAKVNNGTGLSTDWRGYTIVPYLNSYRRSRIALEPSTLKDDVDIKNNVTTVVPTAGAVVAAAFKTNVGHRVLITFQQDKFAVPFGAMVSVDGSENPDVGIVNENGEVYLSGLPERGSITAKWGLNNEMKCHADFVLPASTGKNKSNYIGLQQINVICK